jgi:hypothetical protein
MLLIWKSKTTVAANFEVSYLLHCSTMPKSRHCFITNIVGGEESYNSFEQFASLLLRENCSVIIEIFTITSPIKTCQQRTEYMQHSI